MPGRLTRRSEFLRVAGESARTRCRCVTEGVIVQAARRIEAAPVSPEMTVTGPEPGPRFGFTATKKIGGAVVRNRVKRRLRALAREVSAHADPSHDYVFIGRATTASRDYHLLQGDVETALRRLKLWHERDDASSSGSRH